MSNSYNSNLPLFRKTSKILFAFFLGILLIANNKSYAQCSVNQKYDKIVSGYHSSIALADNGNYLAWGQDIANDGLTDQAGPPKALIASNYGALTGTVLLTTIGGPGSGGKDQYIALTTTGLFAWGAVGSSTQGILSSTLKSTATFGLITTPTGGDATTKLPSGVTPSQVTMMIGMYQTLALVANGNVYILTQSDASLQGDGTPLAATTWHKVKISAGVDLSNVTEIRGQVADATTSAIMAITSNGLAYTWGKSTYLGNGTAVATKSYATQMTLPVEFNSTNLPKMIGVTGGINSLVVSNSYFVLSNSGALYSLGDNHARQLGDFTTTERTSWVNVKSAAGTNFSNVNFISVQEHTGKMASAALITKTGVLYSWGDNDGNMIGRTSDGTVNGAAGTIYDPGTPVGFIVGVDKAIFTEQGGHTLVYVKEGSSTFCYVGHRTNGSMGESTTSSGTVVTFDCTNTPSISLCGAVPIAADPTKSTISASPTTITANGTSTSTISIQLKNASGGNLTTTGGNVSVTTTDGTLGTLIDNNNGTYAGILTSSTNVNTATIGFSINGTTATGANSTASVIFSGIPALSTTGTLNAFSSCTGAVSSVQSFTISGTYLTSNIEIGALTGYEYSLSSGGTFTSTLSLTPSSGTVANTTIYVRLSSIATNGAGGNIAITSTGVTSQNIATGSATVNTVPTITLGSVASVSGTATSFNLPFTATTGSPDKYSITPATPAMSGFTAVSNATLGSSPIAVAIPASSDNTYGFNISVTNSTTGCTSTNTSFNVVVNSSTIQFTSTPVLTVLARNQYLYSISAATTTNNTITFSDPTNSIPSWLALSSSAQTNGQQIGGTITQPGAVTGDLNGNIYVVQNNGTGIYKITPNGTTTLFATRSSNGFTYGGALVIGHYLYISFYSGSYGMAQYDLNSPNPTGVNMLPGKSFLSMTYFNGFIYAASYSSSQIMKIAIDEASPENSTSSIYITNSYVSYPFGLSFNSNGDLFVAEYSGRNIKKFANGSTTTSTIVQSGFTASPSDVKIDANNNVYVSFSGTLNSIRKYTPDFSSYINVSGTTKYVWGMSLNSNGTLFYGDYQNNKVFTLQTNATLLGTPQTPQVGQWPISLDAYDQVAHATQNFIINVLPNVPMPVTAQSATAGDGSATITFTPPTDNGGATVTSYTVISSPGNYSVTSSGSPVTISGLTNGTAYTFTIYATNSVGNSTNVTTSPVTPFSPPIITTTGTLTAFSACTGVASATQSLTVSAVSLTNNLSITAPAGYEMSTSAGGTYSNTISLTPTSGTVANTSIYVRLTSSAFNGASGNISAASISATTKTIATGVASVNTNLTASVTISSNANANTTCAGTNVTFTASPVNGGTTPTYQWKVNGINVGTNTSTYSTNSLSNNDIITVVMVSSISSCISGSPATSNAITMTVNAVPSVPGSIAGLTTICLNSNQVYSVASVSGATAYTWVVTGNISATASTNNVINITASNTSGSGTIKVLASNACGSSAYSTTLNVNVNNTPAPTANFITTASNVCLSNAGVTFTNTSSVNGNTLSPLTSYSWDFGDGSSIITTNNASNTYSASGSYDAILTISDANACTSSISTRIVVDPLSVPGTASATNATICYGNSTAVNLTGNLGTIQWMSSPSGANNFSNIIGATSNILNTGTLTSSTDFLAVVRSGACTVATTSRLTVNVNAIPSLTLGSVPSLNTNSTSFDLPYSNEVGSPDTYSVISTTPNALPNFVSISNYGLSTSPISISIPASASGIYNFNLTVSNRTLGCSSALIPFTISIAVPSPAGLSYTTPNVYTVGTAISVLNPTSTGGAIASYSVSPTLPAGLTLNTTSGIISGTPTAVTTQSSYIVTGTNASGTITATVIITVNVAAPASLSYTSPNVYTVGTTITALNPTSTGGTIASYSVSPALPAGLTLNTTTGIITGSPTTSTAQASYVVTGTNASGYVNATIVITVNVAAPASLSYTTPNLYTVGTAITALNPTSTGGTIASYSVSPALPAGLTLNTTTGIITGSPTVSSAQANYVVTGTNATGSVNATVVITVNSNITIQPPPPPPAKSIKYVYGNISPNTPYPFSNNLRNLPTGTIPVYRIVGTTSFSTTAPSTPTSIGKYIYQIGSYDTTTLLYSTSFVNDTIVIAPPAPTVIDSTYVYGVATNPTNIGVQVTGLTGAIFRYFYSGALQSATPGLGTSFGTKKYAATQTINEVESDSATFNVTLLDPNSIIHLQKIVDTGIIQSNSTFNYPFTLIVSNLTNTPISNIVLTDNLQNSVPMTSEFSVVKNMATGGLNANSSFNGINDVNLTLSSSKLAPLAKDTSKFMVNIVPKGYSGTLTNIAYVKANTKWGTIIMQSSAVTKAGETIKTPTNYYIKDLSVYIPEGFSPNHDGVHDNFVIIKPYNITLELEVFNRWGNIVYSNSNYKNEWDGKGTGNFAGQDLVDGGYYYSLRAVDDSGKVQVFKGFVIIQR